MRPPHHSHALPCWADRLSKRVDRGTALLRSPESIRSWGAVGRILPRRSAAPQTRLPLEFGRLRASCVRIARETLHPDRDRTGFLIATFGHGPLCLYCAWLSGLRFKRRNRNVGAQNRVRPDGRSNHDVQCAKRRRDLGHRDATLDLACLVQIESDRKGHRYHFL